eukprot:484894-Prymnesium_polylepis.1
MAHAGRRGGGTREVTLARQRRVAPVLVDQRLALAAGEAVPLDCLARRREMKVEAAGLTRGLTVLKAVLQQQRLQRRRYGAVGVLVAQRA